MPVNITSLKWQDEYTGNEFSGADPGSPNFMGCVGDFMIMVGYFNVAWSTLNKEMKFLSGNKTITRTDLGSFITDGFQPKDTITITGTATNDGNYNIVSVTTTTITVVEAVNTETDSSTNIYGTTPVNYLDFYYNLVGNNDQNTFKSLTDNEGVQRYTGSVNEIYGTTFTLEPNATSKAWYNGQINKVIDCKPVITSLSTDADHRQLFRIDFPFLVTPFFKAEQLLQLQNAFAQNNTPNPPDFIPPSYFNDQCLGFLQQIDAKFSLTSSKADHTTGQVFSSGSTAWYDEFIPSGTVFGGNVITDTQYDFVSIKYTDVSSNVLPAIDFNQTTNVEIRITNVNNNFGANFPYVLNFCWLPTNSANYQGYSQKNQNDFRKSFLHDRVYTAEAVGTPNGDQFGTSTQVIVGVTSTITSNVFIINFQITLGSYCKSVFENNNKDYLIWVTPQHASVTSLETTNRSAIMCDVNTAFTNTDDASLFSIVTGGGSDVQFFSPYAAASPKTNYNGNTGQYGYAKCDFLVNAGCIIESINISFQTQLVSDAGVVLAQFPIEEWNNNTADFYDGETTQIPISEIRGFFLADDDKNNIRSILRKTSLDVGTGYYSTQYGYEIIYGFQLGYQFWQSLQQFDKHYLKYHTQYWAVYSQGFVGADDPANFGKYIIGDNHTRIRMLWEWNIRDTSTDIVTTFQRWCDIYCADEAGNASQTDGKTQTFDIYGNSLNGVILLDGITKIITTYEQKSGTITIGASDTVGEMVIYYENGNANVWDRILTTDSGPMDGSGWVSTPTIAYTSYNVVITGIYDASKTKPIVVRPYAHLNYSF